MPVHLQVGLLGVGIGGLQIPQRLVDLGPTAQMGDGDLLGFPIPRSVRWGQLLNFNAARASANVAANDEEAGINAD